ncbi:MAG: thiamine pyrophosphate-dependent enzyme [Maricaulaceae bacterium]
MAESSPRVHVPAPQFRPGDSPDFSHLKLPRAGQTSKPAADAAAADMRDLAYGLVGVLDHNHQAVGAWDPGLAPATLIDGLKTMVLTREFDDRMLKMQRTKRLSFYMKSLGEEAVAVAAAMALKPDDMLFPSYRQQGALITRGKDLVEMMCHCISNAKDNLKGRQLPVHYTSAEHSWFTVSGNLCTQFPQSVGWAMASAMKGEDRIAASWIGEGSSAEGDFHAACTLASVYRAPVILNVVNNQWAISMFQGLSGGEDTTFASKAIGYGLAGVRVDGNDFLAVYAATQWAAKRARSGAGATLLETYTYRAEAHSTSDDPSKYRPKDEWKSWPLGDPIERLKLHLIGLGVWTEAEHEDWRQACQARVAANWKEAYGYGTLEEGPHAPVPTMFEDVLSEQPWHLRRQRQDLGV